jgi:Zn-finger domain-containing protein
LPKIVSHFSTDSICSKDLEREALSLFPLFRLAENCSASFNRLDFVKDLEREALSAHPTFRLAENYSPSFNHLDFMKDLEREALSPPILSGLPKIIPHLSIISTL